MKLRFIGILSLILGLFIVFNSNIYAQVNGVDVGPELPDPQAGTNVVCANGFTGTTAVINNLSDAQPTNTAPCAHVVLRVNVQASDLGSGNVTRFANQLNASVAFNNGGTTIVVLGVELNNLDQQGWNGVRSGNTRQDLITAASQYAQIFNEFSSTITDHSKYQIAPAPPDLYNAVYDPTVWVSAFASHVQCSLVDQLVADVFNVTPASGVSAEGYGNLETHRYLEAHICSGKRVSHLEGWGAWPGDTIQNQINFLKSQQLPEGISTATSLIVNNCGSFGGNTGGNSNPNQPWLYWIPTTPDVVYNADGSQFDYATCGGAAPRPFDVSTTIPCDATHTPPLNDPEFHSLRPYPANPCDKHVSDTAMLCSNDLIVVKATEPTDHPDSCFVNADGSSTCRYSNVPLSVGVSINLNEAKLPIMGNTEDVPNATWTSPNTSANNLTPAQRMNNYVSWYLNGVINRAEEDFSSFDVKNLVDYSGPLNKLLPWAGQVTERLASVTNAIDTPAKIAANPDDKSARHDQIVGCLWANRAYGFGAILPCYVSDDFLSSLVNSNHSNSVVESIAAFVLQASTVRSNVRLTDWSSWMPPLERDYHSFSDYWRAYLVWRGGLCSSNLLGTRFYLCVGLSDAFALWSNLFPYTPLATTEDRVGTVGTSQASVPACRTQGAPCSTTCANGRTISDACPGAGSFDSCSQWATEACATVDSVPVGNSGSSQSSSGGLSTGSTNGVTFTPSSGTNYQHNLYFAHVQEDAELAKKLQDTFKSVYSKSFPENNTSPSVGPGCVIASARSNSGDNLYGNIDRTASQGYGRTDQRIQGTVNFYGSYTCTVSGGHATCSPASASLSIFTQSPELQTNWDELVGGSQSVFKRFFPKMGGSSPVNQIQEIPAFTTISYNADSGGQVAAGSGAGGAGSSAPAQIYFPYVGGIQEYFLDGIQSALRPKGMGVGTLIGAPPHQDAGRTTVTQ